MQRLLVYRHEYLAIHFGRVGFRTPYVVIAFLAVYHHRDALTDFRGTEFGGDALLHGHQFVQPRLLYLFGYIVLIIQGGVSALLLTVSKSPHAVETHLAHKFEEFVEVFLRLARKSDHQRGANTDAGHLAPHLL